MIGAGIKVAGFDACGLGQMLLREIKIYSCSRYASSSSFFDHSGKKLP